jgi:hypothetical protein
MERLRLAAQGSGAVVTQRVFADTIEGRYCELTCNQVHEPATRWEPATNEYEAIDLYVDGELVSMTEHQDLVDRLMEQGPCR